MFDVIVPPGPPKLTFIELKRCQFLFILSMEQDGVFQKILTSPISLMNIFFGTPCIRLIGLVLDGFPYAIK